MGLKLEDLLSSVEVHGWRGRRDLEINGVASHSSRVGDGYVFVAVKGTKEDGHLFADGAIARGARAIIVERFLDHVPTHVTQVKVANSRRALAQIASNFHGIPSRRLVLAGITGTNGKTTTSYILEAILRAAGCEPAVMGTISYRWKGKTLGASTTTPDPVELHSMMAQMVKEGVTHLIMEVTSHALDQERVAGCEFQVGVFTNLTRDHLDYHCSMSSYLDAKTKLFSEHLKETGFAVLNSDDPSSHQIAKRSRGKVIWYGKDKLSQMRIEDFTPKDRGTEIVLSWDGVSYRLYSPLLGKPNVMNVAAACCAALALGVDPKTWALGLKELRQVPGRMELVQGSKGNCGIKVFVDYAHTPDALDRALETARGLTMGRLIAVFGCGGDRDRGKRPLMAEAASRHCDLVVVTSDNPRSEPPGEIIQEIVKGFHGTGFKRIEPSERHFPAYTIIEERAEAIKWAVMLAEPGDVVVIAGKGHETYQIVGNERIPFDDREVAQKALDEKLG